MSIVSKSYTFTAGATIVASEHNSNFDTIYNDYNGNIDNSNLSASAGIADSKLAQITTYAKVKGSAISDLATITSAAGAIPIANGGLGADLSTASLGSVPYFAHVGTMTALASSTSGFCLFATSPTSTPVFARAMPLGGFADVTTAYGATLATTDGFVVGYATPSGVIACQATCYSDANANPTTVVCVSGAVTGGGSLTYSNIFFPVKRNNYWKIVLANATMTALYWVPLGV